MVAYWESLSFEIDFSILVLCRHRIKSEWYHTRLKRSQKVNTKKVSIAEECKWKRLFQDFFLFRISAVYESCKYNIFQHPSFVSA